MGSYTRTHRIWRGAIVGFLVGVIVGALGFRQLTWVISWQKKPPQTKFVSREWKADGAKVRGAMTDDLVVLLRRARLSRDEVLDMLGPPADTITRFPGVEGIVVVYYVDYGQRFLGIPHMDKFGIVFRRDDSFADAFTWD